ncbi:MAG: radical SAM protein [Spirochaetia bacterium]|nr:radical SAM protein [Spirochaetia bacterium]
MEKPYALLIAPPVYDFALYDLFLKPYALLKIGRWLELNGWQVSLLNCLDYSDQETLAVSKKLRRKPDGTGKFFKTFSKNPPCLDGVGKYLSRYGISRESFSHRLSECRRPDIVLIASGMTYWYYGVIEAVEAVRRQWGPVPVAVGGIYATLMTEHCRNVSGADFVIKGDAQSETGLNQIFRKLDLPECDVPWNDDMLVHPVLRDAAVLRMNRGCPCHCSYCASRQISSFEKGSPELAFALMEKIHRQLGTVNFAFYDDAILVKKEEVFIPFLRMVERSGYKFNFYLPNALHLDRLDPDTAALMVRCGFREIRIGFESSDIRFHDQNDRKLDLQTFPEKVDMLFRCGFSKENIGIYVLAGLPGQYAGEVEDSLHYLAEYGLRGNIAEYSTVPGTILWDECVRKSKFPVETEPICHNNSIFPMQWDGFTVADMERLKRLSKTL